VSTQDPIVVALGSIAAGSAASAAVITAGLIILRTVQRGGPDGGGPEIQLALLGTMLFTGLAVGIAAAWTLSRPIADLWRRGVTSALSVFGATVLAAVAAPADLLAGRVGLAAYLILLVFAALYTSRATRKAAKG
jgi:hypothetical protein